MILLFLSEMFEIRNVEIKQNIVLPAHQIISRVDYVLQWVRDVLNKNWESYTFYTIITLSEMLL